MAQRLGRGEADGCSGFELRCSDGGHGCAEDFCDVGAGEQGEGDDSGPEPVLDAYCVCEHVEQDVDLCKQGSSSDDGDVPFAEVTHGEDAGVGTECGERAQKRAQNECCDGDRESIEPAMEEQLAVFSERAPVPNEIGRTCGGYRDSHDECQ